ncbi:MFS transporter [Microbacterium sp. cx-55]|uniref:MFS transporter n=1 Tax=Microbacterium sp. cx-55 TaxID=2875948 RepID=UPI001CBACDC5|nr:MFS transporter [Microbacterium sp. cx-55]MBZ4487877.1 MFS transporter [Microbacterium sp. cx-55]UGB34712.1 MFS transporter [Microbacterium sp. cx-55]
MTSSTASVPTVSTTPRMPLRALLVLSAAVLVTVTAESLPAGLLPEMADDLRVSPEQIGSLISVWALTVIVTSLPLARLLAARDRRLVLGIALAVFAVANLATSFAPDYGLVIATRVVAAVAHGVFWSVVVVYATSLLSPTYLGRGLAIVTAGGTLATALTLPAATLLAQAVGWRPAFVLLSLVAAVLAVVIIRSLPARATSAETVRQANRGGFWRDPSTPAILVFSLAAVLIAMAQFASFTYVRPYLSIAASIEPEWAAGLLLIYGAAGLLGVVLAGYLADRFPRSSLSIVLVVFTAAFVLLTVAAGSLPAVIVGFIVWGLMFGAVFPLLNAILMRTSTERTRPLASAGVVVFFNIGIATGPWLGAVSGGATSPAHTTAVSASAMLVAAVLGTVGVLLARRLSRR